MLGARLGCVAPVFDHGLGRVDDAVPLGAPPPLRPRPGLQAGPRLGQQRQRGRAGARPSRGQQARELD